MVVIFTGNDIQETRKDNLFGIGKPWFEIKGSSMKVINDSLPRYSCTNLLSRSWTIGVLGLKNLAGKICKNNKYDGMNSILQMEKILLKIDKLVSSKNASLLFILSPTIYDYYQEGFNNWNCSSAENPKDCSTARKNMQKLLLTNVKYSFDFNNLNSTLFQCGLRFGLITVKTCTYMKPAHTYRIRPP